MTVNEQTEKLAQAKRLVEEVRDSLNVEKSVCDQCGLTSYKNFGQFQTHDTLSAVLTRLEKVIERMGREPEVYEDRPEHRSCTK
jgi:hypothetical protein